MIDLLVSLAVISLLIGIMLPAVGKVRESTRKIICGSNLRQVGMGISVYTADHKDKLPNSVFLPVQRYNTVAIPSPQRMDTLWLTEAEFPEANGDLWDGLGILYGEEYITAPSVFYCPSHHGNFVFEDAADEWNNLDDSKEIIANYLFRGAGPRGSRVLYNIEPAAAIVTDSLHSYEDLNHEGGFNILQAGLAVNWFEDGGEQIAQELLLRTDDDINHGTTVVNAWDRLDGFPGANTDAP